MSEKLPVIRSVYDGQGDAVSDATGLDCRGDPGLTKQEFRDECDLNTIMRQYTQTGIMPQAIVGSYGDFSSSPDFLQAQLILVRAREQFEAMPAEVRIRFQNDAAAFLDFVNDKENFAEARKLGLLKSEPEPVVADVPAVPPVKPAV